jgi:hypothetical protein
MSIRGRITVEVICGLVAACLAVGGIVFAAGGLATKAYADQAVKEATAPLVRKDAIEPQLETMKTTLGHMQTNIEKLLERSGGK